MMKLLPFKRTFCRCSFLQGKWARSVTMLMLLRTGAAQLQAAKSNHATLFYDVAAHTVSGRITSADDKQGMPGVNIVLKGTTIGTTTDVDGKYAIELPDGDGVLVFTFIGYERQEVPIGGRTTID